MHSHTNLLKMMWLVLIVGRISVTFWCFPSNAVVSAFAPRLGFQPLKGIRIPMSATEESLEEMDPLQRMLFEQELSSRRKGWLEPVSNLPFECTSCGKCCRTIGNVFMAPEEVEIAATYLNLTVGEFVDDCCEQAIHETSPSGEREEIPWALLKNKETKDGPACIFLDMETNHCQIYPARPTQCSTYPFWTNILKSDKNWNDEARRIDDNDESSPLPAWTAENGGCEGIKLITNDNTSEGAEGVPVNEALKQLSLHERMERRLPRKQDYS